MPGVTAMRTNPFSIALETPVSGRRNSSPVGTGGWVLSLFVGGRENHLVQYVFEKPRLSRLEDHSPIVFHGPSGVGKTALAITLASRWAQLTGHKLAGISTANDFSRDLNEAIEADDVDHFRRKFRKSKLLLIDDIHELAGKSVAQEELISTLDLFETENRPVIVTCPRLPTSIRGLKSALASRLSRGLQIPVAPPGEEAREAILRELAIEFRVPLDGDALKRFASRLPEDSKASQLRAAVMQMQQLSLADPDRGENQVMRDVVQNHQQSVTPSMAIIGKLTAKVFQVKLSDLRGSTRKANIVRARGVAIYIARETTQMSLQEIGRFFAGRDHSTVLYAYRKAQEQLQSDRDLAQATDEIMHQLQRLGMS